ncbi:hypothetical protein JNK13_11005 [bacterium]|nr:hypothetical protein [bacterium]
MKYIVHSLVLLAALGPRVAFADTEVTLYSSGTATVRGEFTQASGVHPTSVESRCIEHRGNAEALLSGGILEELAARCKKMGGTGKDYQLTRKIGRCHPGSDRYYGNTIQNYTAKCVIPTKNQSIGAGSGQPSSQTHFVIFLNNNEEGIFGRGAATISNGMVLTALDEAISRAERDFMDVMDGYISDVYGSNCYGFPIAGGSGSIVHFERATADTAYAEVYFPVGVVCQNNGSSGGLQID